MEICRKVRFVLLSDSDLDDKGSSVVSKPITHFTCRSCLLNSPYIISNIHFSLKSLKNFAKFLKTANEKNFIFHGQRKLIQSILKLPNPKQVHSVGISKLVIKSSQSSDFLRGQLDIFMLLTLSEMRNFSIEFCDYHEPCIREYVTRLFLSETSDRDFSYIAYPDRGEVLLLEDIVHYFLTCYSVPIVSVKFFISPFQPGLWICFILSAIAVTFAWCLISRLNKRKQKYSNSFSMTLLMISSVNEDSCGSPRWLDKKLSFRISFVGWFLAMIVVVNGYIGVLISGLTLPFDMETVNHFSNLSVCNIIATKK